MRSRSLAVAIIGLALGGCLASTGPGVPTDIPDWLRDKISEVAAQPVTNPPSSFTQFTYRDQTVYYRPQICCDFFAELYNAAGTLICAPDGGIAGGGDGRCPDFAETRKNGRLIWADPRQP